MIERKYSVPPSERKLSKRVLDAHIRGMNRRVLKIMRYHHYEVLEFSHGRQHYIIQKRSGDNQIERNVMANIFPSDFPDVEISIIYGDMERNIIRADIATLTVEDDKSQVRQEVFDAKNKRLLLKNTNNAEALRHARRIISRL